MDKEQVVLYLEPMDDGRLYVSIRNTTTQEDYAHIKLTENKALELLNILTRFVKIGEVKADV